MWMRDVTSGTLMSAVSHCAMVAFGNWRHPETRSANLMFSLTWYFYNYWVLFSDDGPGDCLQHIYGGKYSIIHTKNTLWRVVCRTIGEKNWFHMDAYKIGRLFVANLFDPMYETARDDLRETIPLRGYLQDSGGHWRLTLSAITFSMHWMWVFKEGHT